MPTVFTSKNNRLLSRLYDRKLTHLARWFKLSRQIRSQSRVVTDARQIMWQNYFPDTRLVVISKQNLVYACFTTPPDPWDAQIPRPRPYLFHNVGMLHQFPHYGNQQFLSMMVWLWPSENTTHYALFDAKLRHLASRESASFSWTFKIKVIKSF